MMSSFWKKELRFTVVFLTWLMVVAPVRIIKELIEDFYNTYIR
tara:strand:- start:305 stop:433 length:129 start_codon:yes stop_codon:yes gene_type:complete